MVEAKLVTTTEGYRIRMAELQEGRVVWQKLVDPNEACFLAMEIDEALRDIRHRMPPR